MSRELQGDFRDDLNALRQRVAELEGERKKSGIRNRARRPLLSRKFLLAAVPVLLLLCGGMMYAQGNGVDAFFIDPSGNVGIGTAPGQKHKLVVNGHTMIDGQLSVQRQLWMSGFIEQRFPGQGDTWYRLEMDDRGRPIWEGASDGRLKTDVHTIATPLARIQQLRGVTYLWNQTARDHFTSGIEERVSAGPEATPEANRKVWQQERERRLKELSKTNVGVIAQEVETVLPEAVVTGEDGYKSVRYDYLVALLIEALKEQDTTVTAQAHRLAQQDQQIGRLMTAQQAMQDQMAELVAVKAQVSQLKAMSQPGAATHLSSVPDPVTNLTTVQVK